MFGLPLTFAAPLALAALLALPALWYLLRVTPPRPRRIDFPPLRILADLLPERETPARTPPWLMILRLLAAACLILAVAGPVWNPAAPAVGDGRAPLVLVLDNGATAAQDWRDRVRVAGEEVEAAARAGRPVALLATAAAPAGLEATGPGPALERLRAVKPQPHLAARDAHLPALTGFLERNPGSAVVWISDGVAGVDEGRFPAGLAEAASRTGAAVTVLKGDRAPALALAGPEGSGGRIGVRVLRAEPNGRDSGTVRALDAKGLPLAEGAFAFASGATEAETGFDLPVEIRNAIARFEVAGERSAAAVTLADERGRRRRVGLVFGGTSDQAQPLLSPVYYLSRALSPFADVQEPRGGKGVAEAIGQMLDAQVSVLMLADVGALDPATQERVAGFVDKGGLLLRFAGPRLAAGSDDLVPVRLRRGGRVLGGALSWDSPKTLAPFLPESPFAGLRAPADIGVRRQILAEPDGDLARRTWASLQDGTPIVTAAKRGEGLMVLVHVTADTTWSNLPLSGLFVDMLRRTVALAGSAPPPDGGAQAGPPPVLAPRLALDGFGALAPPPATARAIPATYTDRASAEHPPGFYGPLDGGLAVNALRPDDRLHALDFAPLGAARFGGLSEAARRDLRGPLFLLGLLLLVLDTLATLWLGGFLGLMAARLRRPAAAALLLPALLAGLPGAPDPARAAEPAANRPNGIESALVTRIGYVLTGDATVDETSRAGLTGLTQMLASRTALEPGEPAGIDPARDELAFYPLIYWPVVPSRPQPGEQAIRRIDAFMKNGGTVIFDTRDAMMARSGGPPTAEALYLQRMLSTLEVPELEPVPRDHVLTKAFYLVDSFPGRYANGQTWVEALPPAGDGAERRPARAGDGVSPIVITGNDLASAWAVGRRGEALYPVVGGDPRQREMAFRGGVNLVMYALTGNYKADQVHVPALLERLGQ
ncbi:conserved hypothetical membrane protein [Methylobacterium sp. 4-46]|uniref:DUF4159 domain-containing protein n=1 Tax=unclassified Methylobacterium TaxID=2615210 RepID=UPI000152EA95|nr:MULTISPECIES: DUF4159 domain-containing protein [Methylobacterium]ACA18823.1 conserved hypothetical membrane protein [Methylobacterium sp. 4-46]WFT78049.1 DUF4159 domain-containing protein [Methylobacterium nodulans]